MAKLSRDIRIKIAKKTDLRIKLINEIISGITVIKMYTWEKPYEKLLNQSRDAELSDIRTASYYRGCFISFKQFFTRVSLCATLVCFVLLDNRLKSNKMFLLIQCFSVLQLITAVYYSHALTLGSEALSSIKRLSEFLILDERETITVQNIDKPYIEIVDVSASWTNCTPTLKNITCRVQPGTLCVIVGAVGSGKSSLLQVSQKYIVI